MNFDFIVESGCYMASHFSSIGIPMSTQNEFHDYFGKAYEKGDHIKVSKGTYLMWKVDGGVELWGQVNTKNEAIGMNPHFFGTAQMKVLLKERVARPNDNELDGAFYAWTNPQEGLDGGNGYPFVFDVPNICTYSNIKLPQIVIIQLSAFAHEIKGFESEEDYFNARESEMKFAVESFIPSGLFNPDGESTMSPVAQAIFSGRIIDTQKHINAHTNKEYVWAKVSVLGDEIDVVADPEILQGKLIKGGVLSGAFWLSGKILSETMKEEKSFWKKLIGK